MLLKFCNYRGRQTYKQYTTLVFDARTHYILRDSRGIECNTIHLSSKYCILYGSSHTFYLVYINNNRSTSAYGLFVDLMYRISRGYLRNKIAYQLQRKENKHVRYNIDSVDIRPDIVYVWYPRSAKLLYSLKHCLCIISPKRHIVIFTEILFIYDITGAPNGYFIFSYNIVLCYPIK